MKSLFSVLLAFGLLVACTKLDLGGSSALPTPTPTTAPTPGICATPSTNPNTVVVAMGAVIGPSAVSPYGTINGYSVVENGQFPTTATLINQWLSPAGIAPITPKNLVQFANVDTTAVHSAVGFKGASFPPPSYRFPSPAASPTASAVGNAALWSTGRIAPSAGSQTCYSKTFTLNGGTFFFGDLDYYALSNMRDALIVTTPAP